MQQIDDSVPVILTEIHDGVAHIRLNRPDTLNAVNSELCMGLQQTVLAADQDAAVKVLLLSGNGRAFCAGGDLNTIGQLCDRETDQLHATLTRDFSATRQIYHCTKPTVAAVHGAVVGGGSGIAAACDFIVAEEGTRFAFPFLDLGILPDMGILYGLTLRVGLQAARRLLLRGISIKADEANRLGLVDIISPSGSLLVDALSLAQELAKRGGPAMNFTKQHLNQIGQYSFDESMEKEILKQSLLWKTSEVRARTDSMLATLTNRRA